MIMLDHVVLGRVYWRRGCGPRWTQEGVFFASLLLVPESTLSGVLRQDNSSTTMSLHFRPNVILSKTLCNRGSN